MEEGCYNLCCDVLCSLECPIYNASDSNTSYWEMYLLLFNSLNSQGSKVFDNDDCIVY